MGALWNELTESARRGARLSEFQLQGEPSIEQIRALAERRHEELRWFIRGIDAGGDDPAEFGEDGRELLQKLAEASAYFQAYVELPPGLEKQPTDSELRDSAQLLQTLTGTAERLITELLEVGRDVRARAIDVYGELSERGRTDDGLRAGARKVGRNAPCPCGSGRKWKKCHGAAPPSMQH